MGEKQSDNSRLEEKIDLLMEESEKAKIERKKERILSKVDGLYNVLIALSTFIVGVIISQRVVLSSSSGVWLLFSMIGVVMSILFSFMMGFRGMVYDSMKNRIGSWCLLLSCLVMYLMTPLAFFLNYSLGSQSPWFNFLTGFVGIMIVAVQLLLLKRFANWFESSLGSLIGEKVDEWSKISKQTFTNAFLIYIIAFFVSISVVIANSLH